MDPEAVHILSPQQAPEEKARPLDKLPKPKKPSLLIVILVVITVIALTTIIYFANQINKLKQETTQAPQAQTPTETPTNYVSDSELADWKTLNSVAYSYSLKYPNTLTAFGAGIDVDETTSNEVIISSDPSKATSPQMQINAAERKYTVYKDMSLKDIVQADFDANKANQYTVTRMIGGIENALFAGEPAFTFQMESNGFSGEWRGFVGYVGINKVLEFDHNGTHFIIVYTSGPIFDQILSTFQFLD